MITVQTSNVESTQYSSTLSSQLPEVLVSRVPSFVIIVSDLWHLDSG